MVVVLVDEIRAVDLGVDRRDLLQRLHAGLHEEAHEAELGAVLLLEDVLVAGAQRHHFAHVDLVEGRQHRGGVLRFLEAARDGLAQLRHPHALFARRVVGGRRRAQLRPGGRRRRRRRIGERGEHIALQHLAALAGTRDARRCRGHFQRRSWRPREQPALRRTGGRAAGAVLAGAGAAAAGAAGRAAAGAGAAEAPAPPADDRRAGRRARRSRRPWR